jgi:hypothetical protein
MIAAWGGEHNARTRKFPDALAVDVKKLRGLYRSARGIRDAFLRARALKSAPALRDDGQLGEADATGRVDQAGVEDVGE